jgi:DNA-binding MurR/RpiR family transcriptional regulator
MHRPGAAGATLAELAKSYNVGAATISRLAT